MTEEKEVKVSKTDPDSGYMIRDGKPEGFFYLDHRTVDTKYNVITDVHVTPGNVHDSVPYLSRLDRQCERFGFQVEAVALDSGYLTTPICRGLQTRKIFAVIAHRRIHPKQGLFPKWKFEYDKASRNRTGTAFQGITSRQVNFGTDAIGKSFQCALPVQHDR